MNIEFAIFIILTIMHPIADFGTPIRKWGIKSWKDISFVFRMKEFNHILSMLDNKNPQYKEDRRRYFNEGIRTYLRNWRTLIFSEWVLAINPLHALWDAYSPLRRHQNYINNFHSIRNDSSKDKHDDIVVNQGSEYLEYSVVTWWFWRWLAVDQIYHVLTNWLVAWLIALIIGGLI